MSNARRDGALVFPAPEHVDVAQPFAVNLDAISSSFGVGARVRHEISFRWTTSASSILAGNYLGCAAAFRALAHSRASISIFSSWV
jgi:hypothetical protein